MASFSALSKLTGALSRPLQHVAANARVPAVALNSAARVQSRNRTYGGLRDEDRVFKNLYGLHDWGLKGDMKRVRFADTTWRLRLRAAGVAASAAPVHPPTPIALSPAWARGARAGLAQWHRTSTSNTENTTKFFRKLES